MTDEETWMVAYAVVGVLVAAFNVWLVFRVLAFMHNVETRLQFISERTERSAIALERLASK